jgi:hypothetical protein
MGGDNLIKAGYKWAWTIKVKPPSTNVHFLKNDDRKVKWAIFG